MSNPVLSGQAFTGLFGTTMPGTISAVVTNDGHVWTADSNGLYHTANLQAEWVQDYHTMLAGNASTLTSIQRLEGNAEAVFENTGIDKVSATLQQRDREDLQREFDAMSGALLEAHISANAPLSVANYLTMEHIMQGDPVLQELSLQGHGLNNESNPRYNGYTNDIQNAGLGGTRYVGPGLDHNQSAVNAFLDDVVLGHSPFPTVYINGVLTQLNQNGAAEDTIAQAAEAFNQAAFNLVLTKTDFAKTDSTTTPVTLPTLTPSSGATPVGDQADYNGGFVPTTLTVATPHAWVAGANGVYQTSADLQTAWRNAYTAMLAGTGVSLTVTQRMEGNAEAVFEAGGISSLTATQQNALRQDIQRQIDAVAGAMLIDHATYGTSMTAAFTQTTYLQMEHTLQSNDQLEELALQGYGLVDPPSVKYDGMVFDLKADGVGSNVVAFLEKSLLSDPMFPSVFVNGKLEQLGNNGARGFETEATAIADINNTALDDVYHANMFKRA